MRMFDSFILDEFLSFREREYGMRESSSELRTWLKNLEIPWSPENESLFVWLEFLTLKYLGLPFRRIVLHNDRLVTGRVHLRDAWRCAFDILSRKKHLLQSLNDPGMSLYCRESALYEILSKLTFGGGSFAHPFVPNRIQDYWKGLSLILKAKSHAEITSHLGQVVSNFSSAEVQEIVKFLKAGKCKNGTSLYYISQWENKWLSKNGLYAPYVDFEPVENILVDWVSSIRGSSASV